VNRGCPICFGVGWVCENRPYLAWSEKLGCMCGAGMPVRCNRDGDPGIDLTDTSQVNEESPIKH
jgi:hypothetical protein